MNSSDDFLDKFCRALVGAELGFCPSSLDEGVVEVEALTINVENLTCFQAATIGSCGVEDTRKFTLGIIVTPVTGFGGDGEKKVIKESFPIGLTGVVGIKKVEKVRELAHFEMGVIAKLLVLFILTKFMPPLVGAAFISRSVELGGIVEVADFFALEMVVAFETNALASGEESKGAEAGSIGLDGEGVQLGHKAPFTSEFLNCDVDTLSTRVGFSSVGPF